MAIRLPMPDHRLYGLPTLETLFQPPGHDPPPLSGPGYGSLVLAMTPVTAVDEPLVNRPPRPAPNRVQRRLQGLSIIGTPRQRHAAGGSGSGGWWPYSP